ncbi:hypothetical protein MRX96_001530 [Rhipicephalus microplus]
MPLSSHDMWGVLRGSCNETSCDCRRYVVFSSPDDSTANAIRCGNCNHFPAAHGRITDLVHQGPKILVAKNYVVFQGFRVSLELQQLKPPIRVVLVAYQSTSEGTTYPWWDTNSGVFDVIVQDWVSQSREHISPSGCERKALPLAGPLSFQ